MNKLHLFLIVITAAIAGSCVKDTEFRSYTLRRAEYSVKPSVKQDARVQAAREIKDPGSFALSGTTMYVNEKNKGIHVIDISNASNPVNMGFIPIPGNRGIAVRENALYADCYIDLFVFKINSKQDITLERSLPNVFPGRVWEFNNDTTVIKTTWITKDTTVISNGANDQFLYSASYNEASSLNSSPVQVGNSGGNSVGSSLAVFTIAKDHLYSVIGNSLSTFSLADKQNPVLKNTQFVGINIETIFSFNENLFLGSMTGMFIFNIGNPENPVQRSMFTHARVCDPVIADEHFAFVTLRSGNTCGGFSNQMDVLNIDNIDNPVLIRSYGFSNPHGLSKDGNVLFLCDGSAGLKMLDASNVQNITTRQSLALGMAIDVVAMNNLAIVMLATEIKIYSYDQKFNLNLLSTIITH